MVHKIIQSLLEKFRSKSVKVKVKVKQPYFGSLMHLHACSWEIPKSKQIECVLVYLISSGEEGEEGN